MQNDLTLLQSYRPLLQSAAHQPYLRSCREDAEQVAALAFLRAIRDYDPARGPFPAFAKLRVYRGLSTWYRSLRRHRARECTTATGDLPQPRADPAAAAALDACDLRADLAPALCRLPPDERAALLLTTCDGLTQAAAAERLHTTQQAVSRLRRRALRRLSKLLGAPPSRFFDT